MVWEELVAIVNIEAFELTFLITYALPEIVVASGRVNVAAEVPVKIK